MKLMYFTVVLLCSSFTSSFATNTNIDPTKKTNTVPTILADFSHNNSEIGSIDFVWKTKSNSVLSHFELELSLDMTNWETSATIGSSETIENYTSSIPSTKQTRFARLKMVYTNGEIGYSDTRLILGEIKEPVVVKQKTTPHNLQLNLKNVVRVVALNEEGQSTVLPINDDLTVDVKNLKAGFYRLELTLENGQTKTKKYLRF